MEHGDIFFSGSHVGTYRQMPQRIHDLCNVNVVWTANAAGVAGSANPDRIRAEHLFAMAILDVP
jgi:hypothetical protein